MTGSLQVLWDEALTHYDFGPQHPLNPVRVKLTFSLATSSACSPRRRSP